MYFWNLPRVTRRNIYSWHCRPCGYRCTLPIISQSRRTSTLQNFQLRPPVLLRAMTPGPATKRQAKAAKLPATKPCSSMAIGYTSASSWSNDATIGRQWMHLAGAAGNITKEDLGVHRTTRSALQSGAVTWSLGKMVLYTSRVQRVN